MAEMSAFQWAAHILFGWHYAAVKIDDRWETHRVRYLYDGRPGARLDRWFWAKLYGKTTEYPYRLLTPLGFTENGQYDL